MTRQASSVAVQRLLTKIRGIAPFLDGSLTVTKKRCGNPKCRCAREGPVHEAALLTWKEDQKTRTLYVSRALRGEVAKWINEGKRLKSLARAMSEAQRKRLIETRESSKGSSKR